MANILEQLSEHARERVMEAKRQRPLEGIREQAEAMRAEEKGEVFLLEKALRAPGLSFICECKRASPSKGMISEDFPYLEIAREYEEGGAAAISCLTEPKWFLGKDEYLKDIVREVSIPVLRKDFTVEAYQIYEAKLLGASAVLLIVSILRLEELKEYIKVADELGLSAFVETHDEEEVEIAISAGARILGVNNRNLKDFTVDVGNTLRLRQQVPKDILFVAESGIQTEEDIARLAEAGVDAVLMGESLMRAENRVEKLRSLRAAGETRRQV